MNTEFNEHLLRVRLGINTFRTTARARYLDYTAWQRANQFTPAVPDGYAGFYDAVQLCFDTALSIYRKGSVSNASPDLPVELVQVPLECLAAQLQPAFRKTTLFHPRMAPNRLTRNRSCEAILCDAAKFAHWLLACETELFRSFGEIVTCSIDRQTATGQERALLARISDTNENALAVAGTLDFSHPKLGCSTILNCYASLHVSVLRMRDTLNMLGADEILLAVRSNVPLAAEDTPFPGLEPIRFAQLYAFVLHWFAVMDWATRVAETRQTIEQLLTGPMPPEAS